MILNLQQKRKYLRDRFNQARAKQYRENRVDRVKKPPEVKAAEKVVKAWNDKQYALQKKRDEIVRDEARKVEEAMLLGDIEGALKVLKAFEKFKVPA